MLSRSKAGSGRRSCPRRPAPRWSSASHPVRSGAFGWFRVASQPQTRLWRPLTPTRNSSSASATLLTASRRAHRRQRPSISTRIRTSIPPTGAAKDVCTLTVPWLLQPLLRDPRRINSHQGVASSDRPSRRHSASDGIRAAGRRRAPPFAGDYARLSPRPSTAQQGRAIPGRSADGRGDRRGDAHDR